SSSPFPPRRLWAVSERGRGVVVDVPPDDFWAGVDGTGGTVEITLDLPVVDEPPPGIHGHAAFAMELGGDGIQGEAALAAHRDDGEAARAAHRDDEGSKTENGAAFDGGLSVGFAAGGPVGLRV